jgi:hypothetical protein
MEYNLAQINIGKIRAAMDSPVMYEFAANLDRINALAESSHGFVWRLKDDSNNASSIKIFDDEFVIINMSVWKNQESLYGYVYKSLHTEFLKKRKEWFEKMEAMHMAQWWVPAGHWPGTAEAVDRLNYIRIHGETPYAFNFKNLFSVEESFDYKPL